MAILETIRSREDLLKLSDTQIKELCSEIRTFLVEHISKSGGHLASNLGVVELTLAIQMVFDTSCDRIVFDVGHQAYVHKLLTGRMQQFASLRKYGGLAGFPKPTESDHDAFIAGHASNAVSVALGMARARTASRDNYHVMALLGDGALTGGLAYEGLNDAGASKEPFIVILNDNGMSITPNVGGVAKHLKLIRTKPGYFGIKLAYRQFTKTVPGGKQLYSLTHRLKAFLKRHMVGLTLFEEMGFSYIGPVDGTDVRRLTELLHNAKELGSPVLLHVITQKGYGYEPAEKNPDQFHGVGSFDMASGMVTQKNCITFSQTFGETLCDLATENQKVCAITAAMILGTGLQHFADKFPNRLFDVGIAEGHAVSMAAGLAKQGMIPVVAVYSTFLQRAFDMLLHDVGLLQLHVVFAVDRAGLVGEDGETHHGTFDVSYLRQVPGMQVLCPSNQEELRMMLRKAVFEMDGPVAVRYPRGGDGVLQSVCESDLLCKGSDITLVAYGTLINPVLEATAELREIGIHAEVIKLSQISPLDYEPIVRSVSKTKKLFIAEETVDAGCVANEIFAELISRGIDVQMRKKNLGNRYVPHGSLRKLYEVCGLDCAGLKAEILEVLRDEA